MMRSMKKAHSVPTPQPAPPASDPAEAERAGRMFDRLAEMAMEQAEVTHQGEHFTAMCTQGHTDPNFAGPAGYRIRFHTINTDDG